MARRPPEPPCSFERPRAPSLGRLAHQTPVATPQASVASTQPQLACQRAVGGLAAAFCSGPVLAQWPEHRLSFGNQRGDLDFKEIQKKAGGGK